MGDDSGESEVQIQNPHERKQGMREEQIENERERKKKREQRKISLF